MDPNEAQGRAMLARGLATPELIDKAWHQARAAGGDLCSVLVAWGVIDADQASVIRAARPSSRLFNTADSNRTAAIEPPPDALASASTEVLPSAQTRIESKRTRALGASLGQRVGGHQILEEISRGGMGVVYRARHKALGDDVALKLMLAEEASERDRARFEREARALFRLNHPSVVRLLDYGEDGGRLFLVMELVKGRTLEERMQEMAGRGERPSLAWILRVLRAVARALALGHAAGLVHRDLKPSNVLIEEGSERVVLIDFGIARRLRPTGPELDVTSLTGSGDVLGTPNTMAPEQFDRRAFGEVSPATDLWAFGGLVFYCLTGTPPMSGTTLNIYNKLLKGERPRLDELCDPPPELAALCEGCFALEPDKRWTMPQVLRALKRAGTRRRRRALTALTIAAPFVLASLLLLRPSSDRRWLSTPAAERWTRDEALSFTAILDGPARVWLERRGRPPQLLETDESGRLSTTIDGLVEGANPLRFVIDDGQGPVLLAAVYRDTEAPVLAMEEAWRGIAPIDSGRLSLRGQVRDASPCALILEGVETPVGDDGRLACEVPAEAGLRLALVLRDRAGNSCRRVFLAERRERFELVRAVQDHEHWRAAPAALREAALRQAAAELGPEFRCEGLRDFRCGAQAYSIGRFRHERTGLVFHLIPGGRFLMGNPDPDGDFAFIDRHQRAELEAHPTPPSFLYERRHLDDEAPPHTVTVPAFLLAETELSRGALALALSDGAEASEPDDEASLPVVGLSWQETQRLLGPMSWRLPSEAEWEFACRAGTTDRYFWGEDYDPAYVRSRLTQTGSGPWPVDAPVPTNAFGLKDMAGNVWELCADAKFDDYVGAPSDGSPAREPRADKAFYVMRGGGMIYGGLAYVRSSARSSIRSSKGGFSVGIRPAHDLPGFQIGQGR